MSQTKERRDNEVEADVESPSVCKAEGGIREHWEQNNAKSIDGLPALSSASSVGFRSNGYNINLWTKSPPDSEKTTGKVTRAVEYVDTKFLAGVATGGLFAVACHIIFQHAQRFPLI
jgi:hypothetical protein